MATGTTATHAFVSEITGFCIAAEAKSGSNGDANGVGFEVFVGHDPDDAVAARRVWDGSPSDGIDSGWVLVSLTAAASGSSWSVDGADADPLSYAGATFGNAGAVRLRAGVRVPAAVKFRNVVVRWIRNGRVMESIQAPAGPEIDTRPPGSPAEAEQVLEIVPVATTHLKVVVDAEVSFAAPEGVEPGPDDLFAQIYVNGSNCTQL